MWWTETLRIRKHLLVLQRFRDEWSQPVAWPHSLLQHHAITMPSASRWRVTHCGRESLSSATPPNHKAISGAVMLHQVQNPLGLPQGFSSPLLSSLFITSLVTAFSFHLLSALPHSSFSSLCLTTPSSPVMDIGCVISWASVIFPYHIFY